MNYLPRVTPFGYTVFCDDIRNEIGGKTTLVGVYAGDLVLQSPLPASIPRLGVSLVYVERPGESDLPLSIRVYMPGFEESPMMDTRLPAAMVEQFRTITPDMQWV